MHLHQTFNKISISDEMPGSWRQSGAVYRNPTDPNFNLRRDAWPLATKSTCGSDGTLFSISISDEMPGPWRLHHSDGRIPCSISFQSQTRCQAPGDSV